VLKNEKVTTKASCCKVQNMGREEIDDKKEKEEEVGCCFDNSIGQG
jgi:hypothetical protein